MKFILPAVVLLVLFACKKTTETNTLSIDLGNCNEQPLANNSFQLCFDSLVEDSRCPTNAVCVWMGVAKAKFIFNVNNQQHVIRLSTLDLPPYYSKDTTVAGHHLKLIHILPYPVHPANPPSTITAKVEVTQ